MECADTQHAVPARDVNLRPETSLATADRCVGPYTPWCCQQDVPDDPYSTNTHGRPSANNADLARCGLTDSPAALPALPACAMSASRRHAGARLAAANGAARFAHASLKLARSPALAPLLPLPPAHASLTITHYASHRLISDMNNNVASTGPTIAAPCFP